jgi:hypothetical protein
MRGVLSKLFETEFSHDYYTNCSKNNPFYIKKNLNSYKKHSELSNKKTKRNKLSI